MISIIIPTFNEAAHIAKIIVWLKNGAAGADIEIIVSDGGSTDNTTELAKAAGAVVLGSPQKGRAAQMNYGASAARGTVLYFVHADTQPPASFVTDIEAAIEQGFLIGRYKTKFDSSRLLLKLNAFFTRFDWFMCMGGDQTLFITKQLFQSQGGFDSSMKIMEEYEFCERARKNVRYKVMNGRVLVSARKYETNSWWQVQRANYKIVKMYKKGASQQQMADKYKQMLNYR